MTSSLDDVARYYAEKLREHGPVARGVDWNGEDSQNLRFRQLTRIFDPSSPPASLNDLGCGYGALLDQLQEHYPGIAYSGFDISQQMVAEGRTRFATRPQTRFEVGGRPDRLADYGIASGIFNVRLDATEVSWWELMVGALDALDATSRLGFAFNCLTSYSDAGLMKPHLYYADPCRVFDHCKRHYSRQVALLHDYGLYEFTVLVRKEASR